MDVKAIGQLIKATASRWSDDKASRLAAALAYFALFSVAPLLVIAIVIAGQIFSQSSIKTEILSQVQSSIGSGGASLVQTMIENASKPGSGTIATILSVVTMLLGAMGIFGQLHSALNTIWDVEPKSDRGVLGMIKDRALAFVMVIVVGALFILLFALSTALGTVEKYLGGFLPGARYAWQGANFLLSLALLTLMLAIVYKVLPDVIVAWRDLLLGALITALLISIGNILIGLYLGHSSAGSAYGAAGSLVLLLIWIYYTAQVFFFGAEFTQVYASKYGSSIRPADNAVRVIRETREEREKRLAEAGAQANDHPAAEDAQRIAADATHSPDQMASSSLGILLLVTAAVAAVVASLIRGPGNE